MLMSAIISTSWPGMRRHAPSRPLANGHRFPLHRLHRRQPLLADNDGVMALDARIEIEPGDVERLGPNPDLAIRPYPSDWQKDISPNGTAYHVLKESTR
jgi:hypothetical protein